MISAVIVCLNEGNKLRRCLESLNNFADEIVVVDLGSKDQSLKVSQEFGAKIYHHNFEPFVERVRNFSISKATGEWILILDPDEVISENLKFKLKEVSKSEKYVAVN